MVMLTGEAEDGGGDGIDIGIDIANAMSPISTYNNS